MIPFDKQIFSNERLNHQLRYVWKQVKATIGFSATTTRPWPSWKDKPQLLAGIYDDPQSIMERGIAREISDGKRYNRNFLLNWVDLGQFS